MTKFSTKKEHTAKATKSALNGVAQLAVYHPAKPKGDRRFDSWSWQMPQLQPGPQLGCVKGNWSMFLWHIEVSLPLSLPSPLSKNKGQLRLNQ